MHNIHMNSRWKFLTSAACHGVCAVELGKKGCVSTEQHLGTFVSTCCFCVENYDHIVEICKSSCKECPNNEEPDCLHMQWIIVIFWLPHHWQAMYKQCCLLSNIIHHSSVIIFQSNTTRVAMNCIILTPSMYTTTVILNSQAIWRVLLDPPT
jgi:hypothetical protein